MFPHLERVFYVGHPEGYSDWDILSRLRTCTRLQRLTQWDGMPLVCLQQYAMDTGNDPAEFTASNIANFKRQINALGFSYDWDREVNTAGDPNYYKWTQ